MRRYGLEYWGDDNFFVKDGELKVNYKSSPSLKSIISQIRKDGNSGPILLRFPHLIKKQINTLFNEFNRAIDEFNYSGKFKAVFPLKVNQYPSFLSSIIDVAKDYEYGLEAGSKAELMLAILYNKKGHPITVNGFKDKKMTELSFLAKEIGHDITLIIEGINELEKIIELSKTNPHIPNIGIRIRLHNTSSGSWSKSGGIHSKFGLSSTEIIEALDLLKDSNLLDKFSMIHFHIGSQMSDIAPLKNSLREAGKWSGITSKWAK